MKRINGIFISLIGMLALSMSLMAQDVATVTDGVPETNYEDLFASLAAIVAGDRRSDPRLLEVDAGMGGNGAQLGIGRRDLHVRLVAGLGLPCRPRLADCPDVWHRCRYRGKRVCRNRPDTMADLALRPQEEKSMMYGLERILRLSRCRRRVDGPAQMAVRPAFCPASAEG